MDNKIQSKIDEWTKPPFDNETIKEIKDIVNTNNEKELNDRFYKMLEFGTGGLRGVLGAGTNRINSYTVGMATQGLADYIKSSGKAEKGVVIAFDSRRMSDTFSREAASIFAGNGIKVYIFVDITPTPLCSFAIRELQAVSGIVITASHNPPEYNGYKVYWEDGGQIVSPQDTEIIDRVKEIDSITKIKKLDFEEGINLGIIKKIGNDITKEYIKQLEKSVTREKKKSTLKIVYSPLHGTGYKIIPEVLTHFGFDNVHVEEKQGIPDGDFPTVVYPNPEERDAMSLSIELAKKIDADIIMATDPDADRMGIGFKDGTGNYRLINGNQIGTMLEYYILNRLKADNKIPEKGSIIKTIVTTDLQAEIASYFNCKIENVLTGFKWIALKMAEYDETGENFIFGGEESYGYLPVNFVRDKDAVSSCYFFVEMADWLKENNRDMNDFLNEIYIKFGLYLEDLHSLTLKGMEGMEQIKKIMESFRNSPPEDFTSQKVMKIADIQDLTEKDIQSGNTKNIEGLPKSNVLQYFLEDGSKITMRPSGTEPKIKFYFSVNEKTDKDNLLNTQKMLENKIDSFKKDLLDKVENVL